MHGNGSFGKIIFHAEYFKYFCSPPLFDFILIIIFWHIIIICYTCFILDASFHCVPHSRVRNLKMLKFFVNVFLLTILDQQALAAQLCFSWRCNGYGATPKCQLFQCLVIVISLLSHTDNRNFDYFAFYYWVLKNCLLQTVQRLKNTWNSYDVNLKMKFYQGNSLVIWIVAINKFVVLYVLDHPMLSSLW